MSRAGVCFVSFLVYSEAANLAEKRFFNTMMGNCAALGASWPVGSKFKAAAVSTG